MRRFTAALLLCALSFVNLGTSALADRVITYPGQLGLSTEANQGPRFERLAFGSWIRDALGPTASAGGVYSNLTVVPNGGMYVATQPTLPNTMASLYQIAVNDANPIPATGTPSLPADSTKIVVQALQGGTSSSLGPIAAPGSGLSQYYLVEAQVQTVDTTPTVLTFTSANGSYTNTVPITRANQIMYQLKAGTASSSPAVPVVDSGWIGIATVLVPSGSATITTGMIAPLPAFTGFLSNGQAASITSLTLQGFANGCLQTVGGIVESEPCTAGLGVVNGTAGQVNVSTVASTATVSLAHGDYVDLINTQTITGAKTFAANITAGANVSVPAAGTATSIANYGSAGGYYLFNSIWNGTAAVSSSWGQLANSAGNMLWQYNGITEASLSNAGVETIANLIATGLTASECTATNGGDQLTSGTGCITTIAVGPCLASTGGTLPTLSLSTPLPISCGGTDATSYTSGYPLYYNGTSFASATVNAPLGFAAGAFSCATCVTAVTGTGNIASSGGTMPNLTFAGILPIANGGGNAASYTLGDLLYYNGTAFNSASVSAPLSFASGALSCATCAVTNANNNFTAGQTMPTLTLPAYGIIGNATAANNVLLFGTSTHDTYLELYSSYSTGDTNISTSGNFVAGIPGNLLGVSYPAHNALFVIDSLGDLGLGGYTSYLPSTASACYGGVTFGGVGTTNLAIYSGPGAPTCTAQSGSLYLRSDGAAGTQVYVSAGSGTWTPLSTTTGTVTGVTASGNIASSGGTMPNLTFAGILPIANGGGNAASYTLGDLLYYNGTAFNSASVSAPLSFASGALSCATCVTSVTAGNGATSTGGATPSIAVANCAAVICHTKIEVVIGAETGTVATSDPFFTLPVVAYSGGTITGIRAFCTGIDNGTTVFTLSTVNYSTGVLTSVGTLTLSSANHESDGTITAVNLAAPEGLTGAITTAGTATGCSFAAEGEQNLL